MSELTDRIHIVTDLLMGAVHADGTLEGREEEAVRRLLTELLGGKSLPADVAARMKAFDPAGFDLAKSAAAFAGDPQARKRRLLELVAAVGDSDEVIDSAEDDYLVALAGHLGMKREDYADLALEIEELREALDDVRRPPPLPAKA